MAFNNRVNSSPQKTSINPQKIENQTYYLTKTKTTATAEINNNFIQSNYDMYNSNVFNK
jgi:hypothetical protein